MGQSTNGQICYGILFEVGYEFPWDSDKYKGDIEEWWIHEINGYEPSFVIYDKDGNYINGVDPPREQVDEYYEEKRTFQKSMTPLEIELVNVCSFEYPIFILAIKDTFIDADMGDPTEINAETLILKDGASTVLSKFCEKYGIEYSEPKWWLSSLWC